jgi:hypothetical protein
MLAAVAACIEDNDQTQEFQDMTLQNVRAAQELLTKVYITAEIPRSLKSDWSDILTNIQGRLLIFNSKSFPLKSNRWTGFMSEWEHLDYYVDLLAVGRSHFLKRRTIIHAIKSSAVTDT